MTWLAVWSAACLAGWESRSEAGDWPQILGPARNGVAAPDEQLADRWPAQGPPLLWEQPVGRGYAGPAVAQGRLYLHHRQGGDALLEAFDAASGERLWKQALPTTFSPQVGDGDGPLCVPSVVGDAVITFNSDGRLACWDARSGAPRWNRATQQDFRGTLGYFGAGSTPLVVGDIVVVNVGADRSQAGIVGFDLATGETRWTKTSEQASYSAPTAVEFGTFDKPFLVMVTRYKCLLLDPESGQTFWQFSFGQRGPTVNGATPVVLGDRLFLTSSYGVGAVSGVMTLAGFEETWANDNILSSQYSTPTPVAGMLYGIHGREDIPPADLRCIDPVEGKMHWTSPNFGYASLIAVQDRLLAVKTSGRVEMFAADPKAYTPQGGFQACDSTVRALPALANGRLYVRDERLLKCFDVGAAAGE